MRWLLVKDHLDGSLKYTELVAGFLVFLPLYVLLSLATGFVSVRKIAAFNQN
jgi:hypothetical protein